MSIAFLIDEDRPVIWRGPMLNKALTQFLGDVLWGDLDYLFIDLPPGTGDTQISLIQNAKVDGAIVVSTPQDVAFLDARKAIGLFQTVKVPVAGVIENMSSFHCPSCHTETAIFGHGGVQAAARRMGLPFLGEIPIDLDDPAWAATRACPWWRDTPESPQSAAFLRMARTLRSAVISPVRPGERSSFWTGHGLPVRAAGPASPGWPGRPRPGGPWRRPRGRGCSRRGCRPRAPPGPG